MICFLNADFMFSFVRVSDFILEGVLDKHFRIWCDFWHQKRMTAQSMYLQWNYKKTFYVEYFLKMKQIITVCLKKKSLIFLSLFASIGSWYIIGYCFSCKLQRWLCWQLLSCLWVHCKVNLLMGSLHFELSCCEFNRTPSWAIWCTIEFTYLTGTDQDFMISVLLLNHGT